jgi:enoyl-CoA hydratase/carnithine racemase
MSDESLVLTRREGDFLLVTLNREAKRNALTLAMTEQVAEAVASADSMPEVRAVIVNANGPTFSSGIDLMDLMAHRAQAGDLHMGRFLRRLAARLQEALNRIEATEVPVIGALHGKVIGMGLELALAFDLRVAAPGTLLSIPEARLGLVADVGGTTRLSRTVGPSRAKDLLMTAREIGTEESLAWGLVNRVADGDDPLPHAIAFAEEIAKNAPLAVGMAKLIIDQGDGLDKATQMALERWAQSQLITTEDVMEAMGAFMEKRKPKFRGR